MSTAGVARAIGAAATIAGAASVARLTRTPMLRRGDSAADELARLDAEFETVLHTQLETARRYEHRFTITSTQIEGDDPVVVAAACAPRIRLLDAVTVTDGVLVAVWSGSELEGATAALQRLIDDGALPASSLERTGAATFPTDGFTSVALIEAASERIGTLHTARREQPGWHPSAPAQAPAQAPSRPATVADPRTDGRQLKVANR